ncbi:hypothetical protein ACFE04_002799 [Oxalis oulophora]
MFLHGNLFVICWLVYPAAGLQSITTENKAVIVSEVEKNVWSAIAQGKVMKPVIYKSYPLSEAKEAYSPVCSAVMITLQLLGMYPAWLSWTFTIIHNISVSLALYSLIIFYHLFAKELAPYKPLAKFLCNKGIVFFSFSQHLINNIVSHNLLKPILEVFIANGDRYNLLHSVVLELFEYIRKENLKPLVKYIVDSFRNQLVKFESMAPIHALKWLDNIGTKANTANVVDPIKQVDECAMEKEYEDYFNKESDDEVTSSESISQKVQP